MSKVTKKRCSLCEENKPLDDFYTNANGIQGRMPYCKDCDKARPRRRTNARVIRLRARARAVADLINFHREEWEALFAIRTAEAAEEAEALAATPEAAEHYKDEPVKLRPGQRTEGQTVSDRIDVARCPHCIKHHDKGHVCESCGARPGDQKLVTRNMSVVRQQPAKPPPSGVRPKGPGVDAAALAEFNAGTQRASMGGRR